MLFNDFKHKCLKTQCFSMITKSNVSKTQCLQWFEVHFFKNTMLFNDVKHKCLKTQCFSMISNSNVSKTKGFPWVEVQIF